MWKGLGVLIALVSITPAAVAAQAQHKPGEMTGMGPMHHDSATMAQMRVIHELVANHTRISRTVTNLPNGVRTVTESDDPRLAGLIREHVVTMERRVKAGDDPGCPMESPALRALFRDRDKIQTEMEATPRGIILVQTSSDAATVAALQQHAAEVSALAERGMAAMHEAMMKRPGAQCCMSPADTTSHKP